MKTTLGYGRYDDAPEHVGCPRAASDMTPCIARDGALALASDRYSPSMECVGCGQSPGTLLVALIDASGRAVGHRDTDEGIADQLRDLVREVTGKSLLDQSPVEMLFRLRHESVEHRRRARLAIEDARVSARLFRTAE